MTAHDVRQLRLCAGCGSFGDRREMLRVPHGLKHAGKPVKQGLYHGGCAVTALSHEDILALPASESEKLRLSDTGSVLMRQLLDARDRHVEPHARAAGCRYPACQRAGECERVCAAGMQEHVEKLNKGKIACG